MFKKAENLSEILMLNLLYPAVLGSIFYSVFGNLATFQLRIQEVSCLAMMASVIVFYAVDYLYTSVHEKYSYFELISDIFLLVLMHVAFESVNFLKGTPDLRVFCQSMSCTFVIFVLWDFLRRSALGKHCAWIIGYEIILAVIYFVLSLYRAPRPVFGLDAQEQSLIACSVLSVVTAGLMIYMFLNFYRDFTMSLDE